MTPITTQDRIRKLFGGPLSAIGTFIWKRGVHPDTLTIIGLLIVVGASFFIATGQFQTAAVILIIGLPLDALDGAVARAMGRKGKFGAILDSFLDRYADGVLFCSLAFRFAVQDDFLMLLLAMAALLGSFGTSYMRARAGEAGLTIKIGLMDRLVRVILLLIGLLFPMLLVPIMFILAVGSNITAVQRLVYAKQYMPEE